MKKWSNKLKRVTKEQKAARGNINLADMYIPSIANNNNTDPEELKRVGSAYKGNCFKHHTIISKEMHGLSALITTQS
jgi:hypothetical protein